MDNRGRNYFVRQVDSLLLPLTGGFLTVLVAVQVVTVFPPVRQLVDRVDGRFIVYSSPSAYAQQFQQSAKIQLYLAPDTAKPQTQVAVLVNGETKTWLTHNSVEIPVNNGDKITLYAPDLNHTVSITVNHNNPLLFRPAPGETVTLSPKNNRMTLSAVEFLK